MSAPFSLPDGNIAISFSGGRTSAFMLYRIIQAAGGGLPDRVKVLFANTGREMPETLDFVAECADNWNVPVVWLEFAVKNNNESFNVVDYQTASRDGEPFDTLLRRIDRIPNVVHRFCTSRLKTYPIGKYIRKNMKWDKWQHAIGIRADEKHRAKIAAPKAKEQFFYPLVDFGISKNDVSDFWQEQNFDLRLPAVKGVTIAGNCDFCFLKSESKIVQMLRAYPERAQWWIEWEARKKQQFRRDYKLAEVQDFIARQGDFIADAEADDVDLFCQADGGECL